MLRYPDISKKTGCVILLLAIAGCGGIETRNLVPETNASPGVRIDRTLSVVSVTGAQPERFGGPEMISNEEFKSGLIAALRQAGLFRTVSAERGGDLELSAEFVAQGQGDKGFDYRSAMVVEYWIVEAGSGNEVWRNAFNSRHEVTVGQALSGNTRTVKAQEGSVRKNLAQLLDALATWAYPP